MKKSILIFYCVVIALSLTALGIFNWTEPIDSKTYSDIVDERVMCQEEIANEARTFNFFYNVDTRFMMTITKQDLHELTSISGFLPENERQSIQSYDSVRVTVLDDTRHTDLSIAGDTDILNAEQVEFLRSVDYSTNLYVRADFQMKDETSGQSYSNYSTPHITVVPEKQAVYVEGKDALLKFLKDNSVHQTIIAQKGNLLAGKIYFTVGKYGMISNVHLASSSGFPSIDLHMIGLITRAPGNWEPAENEMGELVDQTLVYSFGIVGC